MDYYCYFKDDYLLEKDVYIHPLSPSTQYGLNVFEGIGVYFDFETGCYNILEFEKHISRFFESSKRLNLNHKYKISEIEKIIKSLIIKNNFKTDIYLKLVFLVSKKGSWADIYDADLLVCSWPKQRKSASQREKLNLHISSWERISEKSMPPSIKVGANYINSRYAFLEAKQNNFDLPLFLNKKGNISESSGACVILIKENKLFTPSSSSDILNSITRRMIFDFSSKILGYEVFEKEITVKELFRADEVFLCGTAIEISLVENINKIRYNTEPNNNSQKIKNYFFEIVNNKTPYSNLYLKKIKF